ncbi:hypothetical protein [Chitinophaga defluvii]|uniref:N-acetyltransferase domain-containing protein n=1 Tax=Chitinophaga defluvii TaxID=3163343 RepID=A0ABV2SZU8_9BACT
MIQVERVTTKDQLRQFIDFPHELYATDPNYVPELFIAQRDLLTPGKHPFHEHGKVQPFLAYKGNKVVGRIAAVLNGNHNAFNQAQDGFFGFFDSVEDAAVAAALFDTAEAWLRNKGADTIIGPVNFSTNETCGLLIAGFDAPPVTMMTYNSPYYINLYEQAGFTKKTDLLAYKLLTEEVDDKPYKVMTTLMQRLEQRGITIRKINMKNFDAEVVGVRKVYNEAWNKNMGFVPMTDKEFEYLAKDLKLILDPDFCMVAEHNGKVVGFSLGIPDINEVFIKIRKGRLFPTGIFKLLLGRKKIKSMRVIALGVLEPYRKMGIEACFYGSLIQKAREKGFHSAEASWILEQNDMMNRALININGRVYRKYRIYQKAIG